MYFILFVIAFCVVYAVILFMVFYTDEEACKIRERRRKIKNSFTVNDKVRMYETKLLLKEERRRKKSMFKHNIELLKKYDLDTCIMLNSKYFKNSNKIKKEK